MPKVICKKLILASVVKSFILASMVKSLIVASVVYFGLDLDWIGLDWIGSIGLDWIGWIGLDRIGSHWESYIVHLTKAVPSVFKETSSFSSNGYVIVS